MQTDADSDIYFSKIEKLVQFFRKYCSETDKESVKVFCEKTRKDVEDVKVVSSDDVSKEIGSIEEKEKEKEREKEKEKERDRDREKRKKKVEVNLLKIWLGSKGDPKWAFLQCDRLATDKKIMHVEVRTYKCIQQDDHLIVLMLFCVLNMFDLYNK